MNSFFNKNEKWKINVKGTPLHPKESLNIMPMNSSGEDSLHPAYSNRLWEANVWPHIKEYISEKQSLMDVGCGNGRRSKFFSSFIDHITAVDVADLDNKPYHVNVMKGIDNIDYIPINFMDLEEENQFDVIYSEGFFYYAYDTYQQKALEKIMSLLKDDGYFIILEGDWRRIPNRYNLDEVLASGSCLVDHAFNVAWGSTNDGLVTIVRKE